MRRFLAVLAVLAVLAGGILAALEWFRRPAPVLESLNVSAETVSDWARVIAYVPLDDRTDNLEDMAYLAEASGYRLVMPEQDWYHTALDGQPRNRNGTAYGNREALLAWVREMDSRGCNRFILSLDQLFSGGLVNSRSVSAPEPLVFPDGTVMDETAAFAAWIMPLAEDPANRVYLFDSIVRLSPTVGYRGFGEAEYYALREYGMVERPVLEGDELTLENVFALYPYRDRDGTPALDAMGEKRELISTAMLEEYLGVRRRKLELLDRVMDAVESVPGDRFQLLIGIDDSSNTENIQRNELRYIQKRLGPGMAFLPGLDSLARILAGRMAQEEYGYQVKASVRYIGGTEGKPSSEFDLYTLEEVVNLHLDFFRAEQVPEEEAELRFLVMTAPDDPERAEAYLEELAAALEESIVDRIPAVLDEASNNAYGDALEEALLERIPFAALAGYAGKYDQANVTGAAFAMGFSRYLYLRCCPEKSPACDAAQVRQIANSMALTEYILHTRAPLNAFVESLGVNRNNMLLTASQERRILRELERLFQPECQKVCGNLAGTGVLSGAAPRREREIREVSIEGPYFPWNRTFELSFTVSAALGDTR